MLLGTGRGGDGSNVDVSNMLKLALARGRLRGLSAITHDEYQRATSSRMRRSSAASRRCTVPEPTEGDTIAILQQQKASYERHDSAKFQEEALIAAVRLSGRYVQGSQRNNTSFQLLMIDPAHLFPYKAIDLVDEACASARL
ncbi:hypothetical protein EJB05_06180, partial [Eragrostis curvula]